MTFGAISQLVGGIGLFLLGMVLLTEGLKTAAGDALRRLLTRFTGGTFSAFASGAGITALVQSSSATTLATIGFVSSGLLTFQQAIGVIIGANVGTTSTGWLVSLLGLKLSIGALAMPLVGVGALLRLLARDRTAAFGLAIAGFGLIFVGIDALQSGMEALADRLDPGSIAGDSWVDRIRLFAIGAAMTVVLQSSSAAVATTLTALHSGAIDPAAAAVLVIGQNVGTTVTAALAALGAATPAKRTALAHILFNLFTALVALALLEPFLRVALAVSDALEGGAAIGIAAFHTTFNLLGAAIVLPVLGPFARLLARLIPEEEPVLTRHLDPSVANVPAVAVEAARRTAMGAAAVAVRGVLARLTDDPHLRPRTADDFAAVTHALSEVRRFLAAAGTTAGPPREHNRQLAVLHAIDHLEQLVAHTRRAPTSARLRGDPKIARTADHLAGSLREAIPWLEQRVDTSPVATIGATADSIADIARKERPVILEKAAAGALHPDTALAMLDAMRWIDRVSHHVWRAVRHLHEDGDALNVTTEPAVP
jgi:phosphate:Na+ symporter